MSGIQLGIGYTVSNLLHVQIIIHIMQVHPLVINQKLLFSAGWRMKEAENALSHAFEHCMKFAQYNY